jgi:DNA-binding winged helix-turn-helix (wHTH) protein
MTTPAKRVFEFGPFRLDAEERVLRRDGKPVPLTLKAFDLLMLLVENSGHIVEKDALMNRVWAGSFVEEGNLKVTVSMLRKALGDSDGSNRYIETVPRRGYRFAGQVTEITPESVGVLIHERTRESLTIEETGIIANRSRRRPNAVGNDWSPAYFSGDRWWILSSQNSVSANSIGRECNADQIDCGASI